MQGKKNFNIGQFLPFIFSVLTFFCLSIGINFGVFQPFILAVFLMVFPGYYVALLISNEFKMGLDEVIILSFIFSGIMLMFVYMILTLFFINVNKRMLLFSLSLLMFFCIVVYKLKYIILENELKPNILDLVGLLFTFCMGLITTSLYMPLQY